MRRHTYWTISEAHAARPRKRKLLIRWTCSDYVRHNHRWKWSARLCGWIQKKRAGA